MNFGTRGGVKKMAEAPNHFSKAQMKGGNTMKKKHYYFNFQMRDVTPEGSNVELTADMFVTKKTAAVTAAKMGAVGEAVMLAEEEEN